MRCGRAEANCAEILMPSLPSLLREKTAVFFINFLKYIYFFINVMSTEWIYEVAEALEQVPYIIRNDYSVN